MQDYVIIGVLVVILILAVLRGKKHFKGGGCCGSGSNTIRDKKSLQAPKIGEKVLTIEGMHCENCEIRVENALNRLDHAACKVNWTKKPGSTFFICNESNGETAKDDKWVEKTGGMTIYTAAQILTALKQAGFSNIEVDKTIRDGSV